MRAAYNWNIRSELDLNMGTWKIPRTKNGDWQIVPLTESANVLTTGFYPGHENKTMITFQWDVVSSFNRNQANQVIDQFTAAVKNGLGA
ncbi:MAG: hypothetical protein BWY75_00390 [bacterium ADurb.Bin425]|jgi:hypothetical protein|nr:MAG: hypothetical protein BWY75_00390 [bacterium ADurb.Bin425]